MPNLELVHVDFTNPYEGPLRTALIVASDATGIALVDGGCIGVTQGPRLESAAEIGRAKRAGCHMAGMTSLPEAALARELELPYASCCIVVNRAAGRSDAPIHDEIAEFLRHGMLRAAELIDYLLQSE